LITSATPTDVTFGANALRKAWANGRNITENLYINSFIRSFIYTFLFENSPAGQTRRRIFTLNGSNDAESSKGVPFGGFVDIASHFGDEIHQNPNRGGVNGRFQTKRTKY